MNVLHISGAHVWGGNEQQLLSLIIGLQDYNVKQSFFCFNNSPLIEKLGQTDITILPIPKCRHGSKKYIKFLKEIVISQKIDLIHLHTSASLTGYVVTDIFHKLGVKVIFSKKAVSRKTSFLSRIKYNYKGIDSIVCVSAYVMQYFKTVLNSKNYHKLSVIYDGVTEKVYKSPVEINLKEVLNVDISTFIIGNIANHTRAKNLPLLVETLNYLVNNLNIRDIHLVQIGYFSKRTESLREMIKKYNLEQYITFLGFSDNTHSLHPQFNVFLLTSEREGGPTVILESFKHKIPVVSTKVGLVDDCVKHGTHAYVAEVGDFKSLAESISKLKNDKRIGKNFANNASDLFFNKFTEKKFVFDTYAHYNKILQD
ncbi:glycosyltransferase involved in cell wall biosynthesis [Gillisia sp. Hel_I_86]|uniref:glycosyltransferase family 4 protein n=1 Tax=Gillisia sp. Hel_I_86 TaxID=1249981 RepID=UPI0011997814|nr:glycosyltransferase family 4 protein [Gillisia sp. Hel_I_86]TVZ25190.1 glycosyltransferase involved in cell wall biosynthesis [Gillisia sp. Hel_I_86]